MKPNRTKQNQTNQNKMKPFETNQKLNQTKQNQQNVKQN